LWLTNLQNCHKMTNVIEVAVSL